MTGKSIPSIPVDLTVPPARRWGGLRPFAGAARELMEMYVRDLGGVEKFRGLVEPYRDTFVRTDYAEEILAVARETGAPEELVLVANLYYDAVKYVFGCTAFAVDTPDGPLHARNLDWWTENRALSEHTLICDYQGAAAGPFRVVGWPGFIGVLSGMAPGRFAVTLNAVLSDEPPNMAPPVVFVLREVLESARSYDEALKMLTSREIASDCLLLVTGTKTGEMAVIERTPTRSAVRLSEHGHIVVTNDYRAMTGQSVPETPAELLQTSCGRYARVRDLLGSSLPRKPEECFTILSDHGIKTGITVQQMVMCAARGALLVNTV